MKTLKVLIIFLIVTAGSGCSIFNERDYIEPLCLPERPILEDINREEQLSIDREVLRKVAENDVKLKMHISTIEAITKEHNEQFKASCFGDT